MTSEGQEAGIGIYKTMLFCVLILDENELPEVTATANFPNFVGLGTSESCQPCSYLRNRDWMTAGPEQKGWDQLLPHHW